MVLCGARHGSDTDQERAIPLPQHKTLPAGRGSQIRLLVVGGSRLGPQVELGAVGLNLAPDGGCAYQHHGQDDQLLHG
jgi:hypothetical protein